MLTSKRLFFAALFGVLAVVPFAWINGRLAPVRNAILEPFYRNLSGSISEGILIGIVDALLLSVVLFWAAVVVAAYRRGSLSGCGKAALGVPILMLGLIASSICFARFDSALGVP